MAQSIIKRSLDVLFVALALPIVVPLCALVALLVFIDIGSPVFFLQQRAGRYGKPFTLYKFRTMISGDVSSDIERITPLSLWIRRLSLDELPQLWNVLKGDMSLVGPRPLLLEYVPRYSKEQSKRLAVLPGVTGWAQINGRNAISWDAKFKLDTWYVDHASIVLDLYILLRTPFKLLSFRSVNASSSETMPFFTGGE